MYPSIREACGKFIHDQDTTRWSKEDAEAYEPFHRMYDRMYESLKSDFAALAKIR